MKAIWVPALAALVAALPVTDCRAAGPASAAAPASAESLAPARVIVYQPVQEYFTPIAGGPAGDVRDYTSLYTHVGTDFGRMGPGESRLGWNAGQATVADLNGAGWTGVWHSLAGLNRERTEALDFGHCYPACISPRYQPRCIGVQIRAQGTGSLTLELKAADESKLWTKELTLTGGPASDYVLPLDPADLPQPVKLLNWVAGPGAQLSVDGLGLVVEYPPMSFAERVFLLSYAKLARNYAPAAGLVRDQQHRPAGAFDALPASGMFALATAAAWRMGMVDKPAAEQILHDLHKTVSTLPRAVGLLPHFVRRERGQYRLHPGTEYSTIDTSLYYHSMLLAAQMLEDEATRNAVLANIKSIRFEFLRDHDDRITHGLREDGKTPLGWSWGDWGGETALVVLLERLAERPNLKVPRMRAGKIPGGIGFIGEVQSLFYPQFGADVPDALSGVNWLHARRDLLEEQMSYFSSHQPQAEVAKLKLYGLSAGEAHRCRGYVANGTRYQTANVIHPHYMLMSAQLRGPDDSYELLRRMESRGLMPPWGLVENVTPDLTEYAPMLGSLNAAFECLGAYHLAVQTLNRPDNIYQAALDCPPLARAIETFYPRK
ncbi:MAG TPA: hypothetical protein VL371_08355 [Gemmataceae bacterium]|jgi:hypothetical protein|nr:hypothetical protein [Gemmataceae bacterium]